MFQRPFSNCPDLGRVMSLTTLKVFHSVCGDLPFQTVFGTPLVLCCVVPRFCHFLLFPSVKRLLFSCFPHLHSGITFLFVPSSKVHREPCIYVRESTGKLLPDTPESKAVLPQGNFLRRPRDPGPRVSRVRDEEQRRGGETSVDEPLIRISDSKDRATTVGSEGATRRLRVEIPRFHHTNFADRKLSDF